MGSRLLFAIKKPPMILYFIIESLFYRVFFHSLLPKDVIPIARDPFGNLICISVSEDSYGKVLFWDHEKDDDEWL
ncbi:SMI1/KNR4 family protein [Acetivibrio clariflavus]|uniref:SMI1/KNR4 family protein n=1 Tax=Acetivibrio clariflavus TaxID=288965 RepID=UPI0009E0164D